MYEAYWGLSEPPFDNSPNPKFFYLSPEHEEALVRLVYTYVGLFVFFGGSNASINIFGTSTSAPVSTGR